MFCHTCCKALIEKKMEVSMGNWAIIHDQQTALTERLLAKHDAIYIGQVALTSF